MKIKVGYMTASHEVADEGKKVGLLYREEPRRDGDSGWIALSGDESQEYVDDPSNSSLYNASTIVGIDPDIAPLLGHPAPVTFERDAETGEFAEVDDEPER